MPAVCSCNCCTNKTCLDAESAFYVSSCRTQCTADECKSLFEICGKEGAFVTAKCYRGKTPILTTMSIGFCIVILVLLTVSVAVDIRRFIRSKRGGSKQPVDAPPPDETTGTNGSVDLQSDIID